MRAYHLDIVQDMASTQEVDEGEVVRTNLVRFREERGLSIAEASDLSGVAEANLGRYERGETKAIPFAAIVALAKIYGHSVDDFTKSEPPPAQLDDVPIYVVHAARSDARFSEDDFEKLRRLAAEANRTARRRKR